MKRTMKKMVSMALTGTMAVAVLAGAGTSEVKAADKAKIGVLVADVSGEEAQGFRSYYENYIAGNYDVEFNYTDAAAKCRKMRKQQLRSLLPRGVRQSSLFPATIVYSRLRLVKNTEFTMR